MRETLVSHYLLAQPVSTNTNASLGPGTEPALRHVVVLLDELLGVAAILDKGHLVVRLPHVFGGPLLLP